MTSATTAGRQVPGEPQQHALARKLRRLVHLRQISGPVPHARDRELRQRRRHEHVRRARSAASCAARPPTGAGEAPPTRQALPLLRGSRAQQPAGFRAHAASNASAIAPRQTCEIRRCSAGSARKSRLPVCSAIRTASSHNALASARALSRRRRPITAPPRRAPEAASCAGAPPRARRRRGTPPEGRTPCRARTCAAAATGAAARTRRPAAPRRSLTVVAAASGSAWTLMPGSGHHSVHAPDGPTARIAGAGSPYTRRSHRIRHSGPSSRSSRSSTRRPCAHVRQRATTGVSPPV